MIDVDLIVLSSTLAQIDSEIRLAKFMLTCKPSPEARDYWEDRLMDFERARDFSEWCFNNDIPTCDRAGLTQERPSPNYRVVELLDKVKEIDYTLQEHLSSHWKKKGGKSKTYDTIK